MFKRILILTLSASGGLNIYTKSSTEYKYINSPKLGKGSSITYLPRRMNLELGYKPFKELSTSFGLQRILGDKESSFKFGFEYLLTKYFTVRSGVQINPNRFGGGFVYRTDNVELSYSMLTHSVLPMTDVFNIRISFE